MVHIAIMNRQVGLIDKILSGEKTIESRWLKTKSAPFGKVHVGDRIYFKESGGSVRAVALVSQVKEYSDVGMQDIREVVQEYGGKGKIALVDDNYQQWAAQKKYIVLMWLEHAQAIEPFFIDKTGFGTGAAWLTLEDITKVQTSHRGKETQPIKSR